MKQLQKRLDTLSDQQLAGMRRGLEKEGLRALPTGDLALGPHPAELGAALTHAHITTDYSESQLELITGVHGSVEDCLAQLREVHQFVCRVLDKQQPDGELLWACSMPCRLPIDETIPLARYGNSNIGRAKSVYRMGLGHRYGRRMQTISGIHYNWSLPGLSSDDYFALIRNFRRHAFVSLYLFGASPALCPSFVQGRKHGLLPFNNSHHTLHLPYATSLRMGHLGYQSEAQETLAVSYNHLEGYAASLHDALTRPYPAYEAIGIRNLGGEYNQLGTSLLQIENEFYGTIRPKRTVGRGERPLHALRERGVEYVEVRLMDLDPFEPLGISAASMRVLDIFLLHCWLTDSPPDAPEEIAVLQHNQLLAAERGREPGLLLSRGHASIPLLQWGAELLIACQPIAERLDAAYGSGTAYTQALAAAQSVMAAPETTPSARMLTALTQQHDNQIAAFACAQSQSARAALLALPWTATQQQHYAQWARQSQAQQRAIEAADTLPFEEWRVQYMNMD